MRAFWGQTAIFVAIASFFVTQDVRAQALGDPDQSYLSRYQAGHAHVAVVEYLDAAGARVEGQRTFTADKPFRAGQGATIPLSGLTLRLHGIEACPTDRVIEVAVYEGPCSGALTEYLNGELKAAPIILCRAFASEQQKPVQDVTCWNRYRLGPVDIVNHTESALLETGAARLIRDDKGAPIRPELEPAEAKARAKGSIIWNPRAGVPPPKAP
ncbi:hypothetical protein [Tabrizicola sp.]|uniref:hypothetical protein n=1 Tax=Tabrizicola sp. TaxID=2005166 RepID=UPI003F2A1D87